MRLRNQIQTLKMRRPCLKAARFFYNKRDITDPTADLGGHHETTVP